MAEPWPDLSPFGLIVEEQLGRGASGRVFRARDLETGGRPVAVKLIDTGKLFGDESLAREIDAAIQLRHPNVLTLHRARTSHEPKFLVLELAEPRPGVLPMPLSAVSEAGVKLASALAVAHDAGIVHSDLKPDNVLWLGGTEPLIADFGTARIEALTEFRAGLGFTRAWAPPWMTSPELADRTTDVWSLAATLLSYHWGDGVLDPVSRAVDWPAVGPELTELLRPLMADRPPTGPGPPDPAIELGRRLQRFQHQRGWTVTPFPVTAQPNWSAPAAATSTTVHGTGHRSGPVPGQPPSGAGAPSTMPVAGPPSSPGDGDGVGDEVGVGDGTAGSGRHRPFRLAMLCLVGLAAIGGAGWVLRPGGGVRQVAEPAVADPGDAAADTGSNGASSDGAASTGAAAPDGASSDGDPASSDGASSDGDPASSDGASSDGASSDGASSDGASSGGTSSDGDSPGEDAATSAGGGTPADNGTGGDYGPTTAGDDGAPAADGERVFVFASDRTGDLDLYRRAADGTVGAVLDRDVDDFAPDLSPDGTRIVFASNQDGPRAVFVAPIDGSSEPRRLSAEGAEAVDPSWAPDGTSIVYASRANGNWDLVLHDLDRAEERFVTTGASDERSPSWSPSGHALVFRSDRTGDGDIYTLDLDDQSLVQVTDAPQPEDHPAWSTDGRIAYERVVGGDTEVFVTGSAGDGSSSRVTVRSGFDGQPAFDGDRLVLIVRSGDPVRSTIARVDGDGLSPLHESAGVMQDLRAAAPT